MKLTQEQVVEEIKRDKSLKDFPEWKDNKEMVLEAVKIDEWGLKFASERLRDDKDIVLETVKNYGYNLRFASSKLKDDKEVVLEAIKQEGESLRFASERLRDDKEIVLEGLKKYGWSLEYASERLRDDKEIVLEGLKKSGWVLQFASDRLKKELLPQTLKSMKYKECLEPINIVKCGGDFLCLLTTEEKNDKEIILEAIRNNIASMVYVPKEIRDRIIGEDNPVQFLEQWIKKEKLEQQLDKKENVGKIKL